MLINGRCHCGNIAFELQWEGDPAEIPARACGCSFCVEHGGVWTSDPGSRLAVAIEDGSLVSKYVFGSRTATFHVCSRCGAVPLVTSEIADRLYAVVNVNVFDNVDPSRLKRGAADFEGEDVESRLARRRRNWIADVRIAVVTPDRSSDAAAPGVAPTSETEESEKWHRRFAMRCNNRAWEIAVMPRSAAGDREMLSVAHASAWHWEQVGTELNRMRAKMLLAEVHALLGFGPLAFSLAGEVLNYFSSRDTPDWEIAFTHAIYAHAACAAGKSTEHREAYARAVAAIGVIENAEDRAIVSKTFENVPAP